ncbi:MAG: methyltransferase domain-containing protein [Acidimicrobiia bacterium]|nr:methyltransferase domain-containing protein [Acidimicrobiia bacterium]
MREKYTHGHFGTVVDDHARRTAANSANFLLPHLKATNSLLDLGCGPGSISLDLADWVEQVVGIDAASEAISRAEDERERRGTSNATFLVGDVYNVDYPDDTFDVVYAHQLLQHLADPVAVLREAYRVLKPGCIVAVRDADYGTMVHDPPDPLIARWLELYHQIARHNGGEPDAGRRLRGWIAEASFVDITPTTSTWTYSTQAAVERWSKLWSSRLRQARMGRDLIREGMATREEVNAIATAFECWAQADQPFFAFLHGEVLARKPPA